MPLTKYTEWAVETAEEHRQADRRCGRTWQCACGPCRAIKGELTKAELAALNSDYNALISALRQEEQ